MGNLVYSNNLKKARFIDSLRRDFAKNRLLYFIAIPVVVYYIIFSYVPMYGAVIAFKNFTPAKGIMGSPWIGLAHFKDFFTGYYSWRIIRNTLLINIYSVFFTFPMPIIFSLLLNEIRNQVFKKTIQTISYLPHFVSIMVICGMIIHFTQRDGVINDIVEFFGGERSTMLLRPELFRTIYLASNVWQDLGWNSIIYISALSSIDMNLYEAAAIDGAGKFKQMLHVTIPGILPTIVILFILKMGTMMEVGFEKVFLLYNPSIYETADVISTFVYRRGLIDFQYGYSTAVGLFNSVVNFILLVTTNAISRKINETSLW